MTRLQYIASLPEGTIGAEIGVLEGEFSAELLSTGIKKLYLIDPWLYYPEGYNDPANVCQGGQDCRHRNVVNRFKTDPRAIVIRAEGTAPSTLEQVQDIDWAYIDANHSYDAVARDMSAYSKLCNLLMLHDYIENATTKAHGWGVVPAVTDWLERNPSWSKVAVTTDDWPTIILRKNT